MTLAEAKAEARRRWGAEADASASYGSDPDRGPCAVRRPCVVDVMGVRPGVRWYYGETFEQALERAGGDA